MKRFKKGFRGWLALALLGIPMVGGWQACELGTVTSDSTDQKPPVNHTAKLQITNQKLKNPGPMEFKLYPASANNILQATVSHNVGTVGENETKTFTVPSGTWKVGYSTYGELFDMPDTDTSGAAWPKVRFSDSVTYSLRVFTNEVDNRTYWQNNFVFVP